MPNPLTDELSDAVKADLAAEFERLRRVIDSRQGALPWREQARLYNEFTLRRFT